MTEITVTKEFLILLLFTLVMFIGLLVFLILYVRSRSSRDIRDRYDFENHRVELEYIRKNLEHQLYDVSKRLEENDNRWRDINHLVLTTQNKFAEANSFKSEVIPNDFLKSLGLNYPNDFEIDQRLVFVLTPFNANYVDTFETVRKVCGRLRLKCIRGHEEYIPNDVFLSILRNIVRSRLIIANITGRNPNVMYELGVAHALGKPTIIISKNFTEIPFDLNNKRIILFENETDLLEKLESSITDMLVNKIL